MILSHNNFMWFIPYSMLNPNKAGIFEGNFSEQLQNLAFILIENYFKQGPAL